MTQCRQTQPSWPLSLITAQEVCILLRYESSDWIHVNCGPGAHTQSLKRLVLIGNIICLGGETPRAHVHCSSELGICVQVGGTVS